MLRSAIVSVDHNGTIVDISTPEHVDSQAGVEYYSGMLIPGFVNAHSHLELSYLVGSIAEGGGFASFASSIGAVRGNFSDEERARAAAFHDARMWSEGVDIVADICNGDTTFALKSRSNIRYINFAELFGLQCDSAQALAEGGSINRIVRSSEHYTLPCRVTPHSTYSLNNRAFGDAVRGLTTECKSIEDKTTVGSTNNNTMQLPLSIHFMESPSEAELYKGHGELWEWYNGRGFEIDFASYESPARRIIETIPAWCKIMLVHNTYIGESELSQLQAHFGDNLTLVLCPRSNHYISRATPPIDMLRRSGVRLAIGTDSLASNRSLSMIDELKTLSNDFNTHAAVPLTTLVDWATIGGAEALGMQDGYGTIEVGKRSGLVLLSGLDWDKMQLTAESKSTRII